MTRQAALTIAICVLTLYGCARNAERPVPRQEAYQRIEQHPEAYSVPQGLPLAFAVSASATASVERHSDGATWLTIAYPAYGADVYCTFTPITPKNQKKVIDNRIERMRLNLGTAPAEPDEFETDGGYLAFMLVSTQAPMAPVQFLATSPRWAASGNAVIKSASSSTPPDSIAPIVAVIVRDLKHALKNL